MIGICVFDSGDLCSILKEKKCAHDKSQCCFFKTPEEFIRGRDMAIDRCRELRLCYTCKYVCLGEPCRKSSEKKPKEGQL